MYVSTMSGAFESAKTGLAMAAPPTPKVLDYPAGRNHVFYSSRTALISNSSCLKLDDTFPMHTILERATK